MADPETIYNWRRLDDRITTSGQPTEQQLADIRALGVRHIVNLGLHTHEKALPDEAASVGRLGMTYIHIPVDFQNPTDEDFGEFCSAMEQLKEVPVHVHCIANYRVSAFFYRYRRDVLGMNEADARAELEQVWHPEGVWAAICRPLACHTWLRSARWSMPGKLYWPPIRTRQVRRATVATSPSCGPAPQFHGAKNVPVGYGGDRQEAARPRSRRSPRTVLRCARNSRCPAPASDRSG